MSTMHDLVLQEIMTEGQFSDLNALDKANSSSDQNPPSRQNESNSSSYGKKQFETVQVCSMRRN
jgi:hypothetical protein